MINRKRNQENKVKSQKLTILKSSIFWKSGSWENVYKCFEKRRDPYKEEVLSK